MARRAGVFRRNANDGSDRRLLARRGITTLTAPGNSIGRAAIAPPEVLDVYTAVDSESTPLGPRGLPGRCGVTVTIPNASVRRQRRAESDASQGPLADAY